MASGVTRALGSRVAVFLGFLAVQCVASVVSPPKLFRPGGLRARLMSWRTRGYARRPSCKAVGSRAANRRAERAFDRPAVARLAFARLSATILDRRQDCYVALRATTDRDTALGRRRLRRVPRRQKTHHGALGRHSRFGARLGLRRGRPFTAHKAAATPRRLRGALAWRVRPRRRRESYANRPPTCKVAVGTRRRTA